MSRHIAYHGTTMGALSINGIPALRIPFEPLVPEVLKDTGLNVVPVLFAVGLTLFWLVRLRLPRRRRAALA